MNVTASERRNVLKLFNVSEVARQLGIPVSKMHWEIRAGRLPSPTVPLGKRLYFSADDLDGLQQQCPQTTSHS